MSALAGCPPGHLRRGGPEALVRRSCARLLTVPPGVLLRSADALHLACAAAEGFAAVYSHDRHLLAAAPYFGLAGRDVLATGREGHA